MRKKLLKQLVAISYTKGELDEDKVNTIVKSLSRSELKAYIRALKAQERKNRVVITSASAISQPPVFERMFPGKKLVFQTDPSLGAGLQAVENDMVYEINLRQTLTALQEHLYD